MKALSQRRRHYLLQSCCNRAHMIFISFSFHLPGERKGCQLEIAFNVGKVIMRRHRRDLLKERLFREGGRQMANHYLQ